MSEITFGETGGGAAMVQGSYVGQNEGQSRSHTRKDESDGELGSAGRWKR